MLECLGGRRYTLNNVVKHDGIVSGPRQRLRSVRGDGHGTDGCCVVVPDPISSTWWDDGMSQAGMS